MFLGIIFFFFQAVFGLLVFDFFDPKKRFHILEKFFAGFFLGLLLSNFVILFFSVIFKSSTVGIICFFVIFAVTALLLRLRIYNFFLQGIIYIKSKKFFSRGNLWIVFLIAIIASYLMLLSTVLFESEDGLKGSIPGWGDTALHVDIIKRLSSASPFTLTHPLMANVNLTYPFAVDFISAIFYKISGNLIFSYYLPIFGAGIAGILLIFCFAYRMQKSKLFAIFALLLILFGSGLGFFALFKDIKDSYAANGASGIVHFVQNPPHEYTHLDNRTGGKLAGKDANYNIVWMVPAISFLMHQRSFALGFAIFSLILLGIFYYGKEREFWRYGILAGLLPLSHSHTFLALFLFSAVIFWYFLKNWRSWLIFAAATFAIALPQILFLNNNSSNLKTLLRPWFGWMTCEHTSSWLSCFPQAGTDSNAFIFWSKNFGIVFWIWAAVILLVLCSLMVPSLKNKIKGKFQLGFIVASLALFAIPNLFLLQPWPFDNNKVLFYWWILAIIFCVIPFLKILWGKKYFGKTAAMILIFLGILAGSFDFVAKFFWTKQLGSFGYIDSVKENREIGKWIKDNTRENSLFLTAPSIDPIPLFLAGRPVYLGFEGWLWTQGLDYLKNRQIAQKILAGDLRLACDEGINYILLDNDLRKSYPYLDEKVLYNETEIVYSQTVFSEEKEILQINCQKP